jgi:membrane-associated phospholipid phosphatase
MSRKGAHPGALERVRRHLGLKATLTVVLVLWFTLPFFAIEYFPPRPPQPLTPSALDTWIGFDDNWIWAYVSLFVYMPLIPLLMVRRADLRRYATGMMSITAAAIVVFLVYPTAVSRPPAEGSQLVYRWLVALDRPSNAVPSLHCAFGVFTAGTAALALPELVAGWRRRAVLWAWCALICVSTLVIKQHHVIDAVTGSALGLAASALAWRRSPTTSSPPRTPRVSDCPPLYKETP